MIEWRARPAKATAAHRWGVLAKARRTTSHAGYAVCERCGLVRSRAPEAVAAARRACVGHDEDERLLLPGSAGRA